ncbi:glucoside xylosyltransferase 2 isoform X3 [Lampris incognitus]|uniref:glucoside xylosyltransferase 2 isoform X3 n=1 Tax=Lampris incognitus TaxID=2546036 RepID=UPI0024B5DE13|nr:glucoside xylosyltransferase 2 isoform X3 [Lampris incognitus]
MRIHCKIVAIALCVGVFLLLYFFGGNAADDPLLREVEENNSEPSHAKLRHNVASKFVKKTHDEPRIGAEEALKELKEGKIINRGAKVNAKSRRRNNAGRPVSKRGRAEEIMHLAVVACGNRLDETLTMVKSAILFSIKKIKFHIFAEDPLASQFEKGLNQWPRDISAKFQYRVYPITFSVGNAEEWKKLFKPCAAQRLFLPNSMIPGGLSWEDLLHPLYQKYKNHITWGDQDLLNIIFHYNPECLFTFPCQWNYRPDHCMYGSNCKEAEEEGVSILHGNRGVYHDDKQPAFKVVYDAIHDFSFEDNLFQSLFYPIQTKFLETVNTLCGRIPQVFLKQVEKTMRTVYEAKVVRHVKPHK